MAGPIRKKLAVAAALLVPAWASGASASGGGADYGSIRFHRETIDGVGIHYQEAGDPGRPTLVLLHGFLSTSRMWDNVGSSPNIDRYDPNTWADEHAMLSQPGQNEIQSTLFYDYRNNVSAYPRRQAWLRETRPTMLVVWGRYDASFQVAGADGFAKDDPNTETHVIDAGHFPLDEAPDEVRALTMRFLREHLR